MKTLEKTTKTNPPAAYNAPQMPAEKRELSLIDISHRGLSREEREKLAQQTAVAHRRQLRRTSIKKKLLKGGVASLAGLSISLAGLFQSPEELVREQTIRQLNNQPAVVMMLEEEDAGTDEDDRKKTETAASGKGLFQRIKAVVRGAVLRLPLAVRALVGVPLWAAGYGILYALRFLAGAIMPPILRHILGFLLLAVILLTVFTIVMKCLFPNLPLRKILSKRNLIGVLIGAVVLKALDMILPLFWTEYAGYKYLIMLAAGLIVLGIILSAILRRRHLAS